MKTNIPVALGNTSLPILSSSMHMLSMAKTGERANRLRRTNCMKRCTPLMLLPLARQGRTSTTSQHSNPSTSLRLGMRRFRATPTFGRQPFLRETTTSRKNLPYLVTLLFCHFYFSHEIVQTADCSEDIPSDTYRTQVSTQKNGSKRSFTVTIDVRETEGAQLLIPSEVSKPGPNSKLVSIE